MNQFHGANESMDTENGLVQQLLTSKFELSRAQTGVSHLRISVVRTQSTETRDAEKMFNI